MNDDHLEAAHAFKRARDWKNAALQYELAGKPEQAIWCHKQQGGIKRSTLRRLEAMKNGGIKEHRSLLDTRFGLDP